ncbi:FAD/NAD(P)-binding protein [Natrarchaeobaculum sulfurireducens]|uniref:FAD-dependent urate hydroxylase HpyO/Asp monooxygenase CreE-like FAD/NAD(P)-binding domain-containing protein n=1 Tax=Natrarchaeobaculum sulfurireducens TaxID=2044521 RepID=A0A346PV41_9EURY|nr:FAD/NAD(P)-binding protein [Natrarchaeobaculum sulfurireducens]AXR83386.1 hypothetical protein AArcMg_3406 [Natrarchaeobaculum sulfurireducens]
MLECAIVGGGIHGTYLAQRLLEETAVERSDLRIVDPHERLLESFRRKARACEMSSMRSTFVHHVGTEPFGLEEFAEARDRGDELLPTQEYPRRPSLSLFLDHADHVIGRYDLESLHHRTSVESIQPRANDEVDGSFVLETPDGDSLVARAVVVAIGHGGRYRRPAWADGVDGISHVWDDAFDPNTAVDETTVVGGGITAAQLATTLTERESVTLLSRTELETETVEADPLWINWNHVERQLHRHPPGSRRRLDVLYSAQNRGTIPPRLVSALESAADRDALSIRQGAVRSARVVDGRVRLLLETGGCLPADRVVLATGFESVFEHPFVGHVADACGLERGYRGMPILEDETLAWRRTTGDASRLFVTGALAAGTAGPLAGTVIGARRAADRICDSIKPPSESPVIAD